MAEPVQLSFHFMLVEDPGVVLHRLRKRLVSSMDFEEYEFHRRRIDRLT